MSKPRVFIVNEPMKYDHEQERMVPAKDLSSAQEWGPIEFIMPAGEPPWTLDIRSKPFATGCPRSRLRITSSQSGTRC